MKKRYLEPRTIWLAVSAIFAAQLLSGLHLDLDFDERNFDIEYTGTNTNAAIQLIGAVVGGILTILNYGDQHENDDTDSD